MSWFTNSNHQKISYVFTREITIFVSSYELNQHNQHRISELSLHDDFVRFALKSGFRFCCVVTSHSCMTHSHCECSDNVASRTQLSLNDRWSLVSMSGDHITEGSNRTAFRFSACNHFGSDPCMMTMSSDLFAVKNTVYVSSVIEQTNQKQM